MLRAAFLALAAAGPARAMPIEAEYAVIQSGLTLLEIRLTVDLRDDRYRIATLARARGLGRLFLPREQIAEAEGWLAGAQVLPSLYRSEGEWRGRSRRTLMAFIAGTPRLEQLDPPAEAERIPVPPEQTAGTIDGLSALLRLSRLAAETGRCDLAAAVFDGRRRLEWSSRTIGTAPAPVPGFAGQALRCALESRLVAGFRRGDDPAEAGRPRQAEAWLAVMGRNRLPLPLRVEFPATLLGALRLDLVRLGPSAP